MLAVITGDIVASRKLNNQEKWLLPLKNLLSGWGERPRDWELDRGDSFQIEIQSPEDALKCAFEIKALIKKVTANDKNRRTGVIDIRMAIGIGEKTYSGETIKESNGTAFIHSGEKFDLLKKENVTMGIKTPWQDFDEEINLYLRLAGIFMDRWSVSSAELIEIILNSPNLTQEEIGKKLGIKQSGVSGRWNRAYADELLDIEKVFKKKIILLLK
ncbi:MAG: hypothetical protein H3C39_00105 [Flavobacteriia bacterium]|mgnify:CR=1 FL=1|nr:hypothetical protein [Flavobacteriia bacterium]